MKKYIKKYIKKIAACMTAVVCLMVPCTSTESAVNIDLSKFDITGNELVQIDDLQTILEEIIDGKAGVDEKYDVDGDNKATVRDLYYAVLRITSSKEKQNGNETEYNNQFIYSDNACEVQKIDREATQNGIKVTVNGSGGYSGYFDYALLYDKDKLKVDKVEWSWDFLMKYGNPENRGYSFYTKRVNDGCVVMAGVYEPLSLSQIEGKIAEITFTYVNEEKDPGELNLVLKQSEYKNDMNLMKQNVYKHVYGCVYSKNQTDLDDVRMILRYVLKLSDYMKEEMPYYDMDEDNKMTLNDVSLALKQALKLIPQKEKNVNFFEDYPFSAY